MFTIFESVHNFWKRIQFLEIYTFGNIHYFWKRTEFYHSRYKSSSFFFFFCTKEFLNDSVHSLRRKRRKSFIDSVDTRRAKILWIPTYTMVSLKDGAGNLWHDMSCSIQTFVWSTWCVSRKKPLSAHTQRWHYQKDRKCPQFSTYDFIKFTLHSKMNSIINHMLGKSVFISAKIQLFWG